MTIPKAAAIIIAAVAPDSLKTDIGMTVLIATK